MQCPCGKNPYKECCGKYIDDNVLPPDPESLMRSRYAAFALGKIKYLTETITGKAAKKFNYQGLDEWLKNIEWQGLTIIKSRLKSPLNGFVTFEAKYIENGIQYTICEKSEFKKIGGKWFYIDGKVTIKKQEL